MKEKISVQKEVYRSRGISDGKQGNMRGMFIISAWYAQIITLSFGRNVEEKLYVKLRSRFVCPVFYTLCVSLAD